ncbi:MAG: hypothetical protein MZW92_09845 [Comamonadaceae bacterium]|nr:hypothetical protein [Comamonadaceae bacterium]
MTDGNNLTSFGFEGFHHGTCGLAFAATCSAAQIVTNGLLVLTIVLAPIIIKSAPAALAIAPSFITTSMRLVTVSKHYQINVVFLYKLNLNLLQDESELHWGKAFRLRVRQDISCHRCRESGWL